MDPAPVDVAPVDLGLEGLSEGVQIGRGGFARVYRCTQQAFGRQVAVKVLDGTLEPKALAAFERECRAIGTVSHHPNIITVHAAVRRPSDGRSCLIMELASGGSLAERLASRGPLPWAEVLAIGVLLAGALETAHAAGLLHRDVKPANVLVSEFGEPQLADFGIARVVGAQTTTSTVTASFDHAAPEVCAGGPSTAAVDVWSLGSTLSCLLSGMPPFWRAEDEGFMPMLVRAQGEPPRDLRPFGVPEPVCEAIEAALAKDPSDRPASAAAFGRLLQDAQVACGLQPTALPLPAGSVEEAPAPAPAHPVVAVPVVDTVPVPAGDLGRRAAPPTVARPADPVDDAPLLAPRAADRRRPALIGAAALAVVLVAGLVAFAIGRSRSGGDDPVDAVVAGASSSTVAATTTAAPASTATTERPATTTARAAVTTTAAARTTPSTARPAGSTALDRVEARVAADRSGAQRLAGRWVAVLGTQPRGEDVPYDRLLADFDRTIDVADGGYVIDTADFPSFGDATSFALVGDEGFADRRGAESFCASRRFPFGCVAKAL